MLDGDLVEVASFDGAQVTVRNNRTRRLSVMTLAELASRMARPDDGGHDGRKGGLGVDHAQVGLAALSAAQGERIAERAGHVREVLTGYRRGHREAAGHDEPRPAYAASRSLNERGGLVKVRQSTD